METFRDFHVPDNMFKIANLVFISKRWRISEKVTILMLLKYNCTTMPERHEFLF